MKKTARGRIAAVIAVVIFITLTAPAYAGEGIWKDAKCAADSAGPTNPCDFCDALVVARNIVGTLLEFAFLAAAVMIAVGAFMMMFAAGSEDRFKLGKQTIQNAVIGLAVALGSWLIVNTILQFLSGRPDLPWNKIACG
ncbi:MAG: hypothetical protein HYU81_01630 [Candidatus Brennerbacteria bacterium]|nr:hypothetical protein [Candidatus Brennerbacteria bacterium]